MSTKFITLSPVPTGERWPKAGMRAKIGPHPQLRATVILRFIQNDWFHNTDEGKGAVTCSPPFPNRTCGFPAYGSPSGSPFQARVAAKTPTVVRLQFVQTV
jgi:hypothetical protein